MQQRTDERLQRMHVELERAQTRLAASARQEQTAQAEVRNLRNKADTLGRQLDSWHHDLLQLAAFRRSIETQVQGFSSSVGEIGDGHESVIARVTHMRTQLLETQQAHDTLIKENQRLRAECEDLSDRRDQASSALMDDVRAAHEPGVVCSLPARAGAFVRAAARCSRPSRLAAARSRSRVRAPRRLPLCRCAAPLFVAFGAARWPSLGRR